MANIFSGTEVPQWLDRLTTPYNTEKLGRTVGFGLSSLANAFNRNTPQDEAMGLGKAGDFKGWSEGTVETRLNQEDPMWKQKFALALENNRLGQVAKWMQINQAGKQTEILDENLKAKQQLSEDEASDQLAYAQAKTEVGNDALKLINHTMPEFKSPKYRMMWQTDVNTAKNADSVIERNNNDIARRQQAIKDDSEFTKRTMGLFDPQARAAIMQEKDPVKRWGLLSVAESAQQTKEAEEAAASGLTPQSMVTGPNGTKIRMGAGKKTPLQSAIEYRNSLEDRGADQDEIDAANAAIKKQTINSLDMQAQRQTDWMAREKQRTTDRAELAATAQGFRIDLKKLEINAREKKGLTEAQFIEQNLRDQSKKVLENWNSDLGKKDPEQADIIATGILRRLFRLVPKADEKKTIEVGKDAGATPKKLTYDPDSDTLK